VRRHLYKIKGKRKVMSIQLNEARDQWIRYLINSTEVWGKIIEAKKGKEAEHYCARIVNIIQKLKKLDQQWHLKNSVSERNSIPIQYNNQSSNHTLQGA
jgi:hypothetical protein